MTIPSPPEPPVKPTFLDAPPPPPRPSVPFLVDVVVHWLQGPPPPSPPSPSVPFPELR